MPLFFFAVGFSGSEWIRRAPGKVTNGPKAGHARHYVFFVAVCVILAVASSLFGALPPQHRRPAGYAKDHVLVKFRKDAPAREVERLQAAVGGGPTHRFKSSGLGDIPAGGSKRSPNDDVVLQRDKTISVKPRDQFTWQIDYDDATGHHVLTLTTSAKT